ncbi:zeta toxin family protein [Streptomyces achromogenes]|uniref:zeta toxin family protein n=1 Tax=Streptomyces achromogenes TaxID=67255 RepID=UPI0033CECEAF
MRPVVVIVGGRPGAGKTKVADLIQAVLGQRGVAVRIGHDLYKAAHRRYTAAPAADVRTAGAKVRPDTTRWQTTVEEYVRDHGWMRSSSPPSLTSKNFMRRRRRIAAPGTCLISGWTSRVRREPVDPTAAARAVGQPTYLVVGPSLRLCVRVGRAAVCAARRCRWRFSG